MTAALCRKRPSPLCSGQPRTWACSIVYLLGQPNFLTDRSFPPYLATADLCAAFGGGQSTVHAKARVISDALGANRLDPTWIIPSLLERHPLTMFAELATSLLLALGDLEGDIEGEAREVATAQGLLPYIPAK